MPSERILDFWTYSHPVYEKFVLAVDERIRTLSRQYTGVSSAVFEENYASLVAWDKARTRDALSQTALEVVGEPRMFDRLWDAVASYCGFITAHGRRPTTQLLLNDVVFHMKTTAEITKPLRVFVTDKEFSKLYVGGVVGRSYGIPTRAVLRSEAEIDSFDFPPDCAVKPTHLSGYYQFSNDGIDRTIAKSWLKKNYYHLSREANYGMLEPKILVEPFMTGYYEVKVYCLFGEPKLLSAILGGTVRRRNDYFTVDWQRMDIQSPVPPFEGVIPRPVLLDEILAVSRALSGRFNLVRVDLYTNDVDLKVGEITNCDNAGTRVYKPEGAHELMSRTIFS